MTGARSKLTSLLVMTLLMAQPALAELSMTVGGDVNFNKNRQLPHPTGVSAYGRTFLFSDLTAGIRNLVDGDLNFANIETVVTDRHDLSPQEKTFAFQSHPNGIRHLTEIGFNLFSLANNHAYDYGSSGLEETLTQMIALKAENPEIQFSGIGRNRAEAARPAIFQKNGHTIAFAAIGIINDQFRAGENRPGMLSYHNESDYRLLLQTMRATRADLKIISIHYGTERMVELNDGQRGRYRRAIVEGDVDLVLGHHPHVVRPIEMVNGRLIIYSLGNYLMLGAADINRSELGYDYGLLGRLHYAWSSVEGRLRVQAFEAIPLKRMHVSPRPAQPSVAAERIAFLNELSIRQLGERAVTFQVRADGTGVACSNVPDVSLSSRAQAACNLNNVGTPTTLSSRR